MPTHTARILATVVVATALVAGCGANPPSPPAASSSLPASSAAPSATSASSAAPAASTTAGASASGAHTAAPSTWASLGTVHPIWTLRNKSALLAAGQDSGLVAYCVPDAVMVSRDGGKTWKSVSTAHVPAALSQAGYSVPLSNGQTPACDSAVADPVHAATVYAAFSVGSAQYGMPPVYHVALQSTDGGAHWSVLPTPSGVKPDAFGGLSVSQGAVQAMYANGQSGFEVLSTIDGGATWKSATLSCPAGGPCLTWGPAPSGTGSCAMHAYPQAIFASADGGKTWASLQRGPVDPVNMLANGCSLNEVVGTADGRALLVANGPALETHLLSVTADGGKTWSGVALPALPGNAQPLGLQMLPDGSLLSAGSGQQAPSASDTVPVDLLKPGATSWCVVPNLALHGTYTNSDSLQVVGGSLWWLQQSSPAAAPVPASVPLSQVHC